MERVGVEVGVRDSAAGASGVRVLVKGAAAVGVIGTLLAINAFFLLVEVPL